MHRGARAINKPSHPLLLHEKEHAGDDKVAEETELSSYSENRCTLSGDISQSMRKLPSQGCSTLYTTELID